MKNEPLKGSRKKRVFGKPIPMAYRCSSINGKLCGYSSPLKVIEDSVFRDATYR